MTWRMEDSDLVWVNELVDSYRGVYDIKIRTVNGVILPTIEEANATREEMEQVRGLLDHLVIRAKQRNLDIPHPRCRRHTE